MPSINLGASSPPADLRLGEAQISAIYIGETQVYGGGGFDASQIPSLNLWFDASDSGGYTVDSATGGVTAWLDKSTSGWDATQADSTKMPTTTSYGGMNWIDFAGVEDLLASANVLISPPLTVWFIAKLNNTNSTFHYVDGYNDKNERLFVRAGTDANNDNVQVATRNIDEGDGSGLESFTVSGLALGTDPHLLQVTHAGDIPQGSSLWINGSLAGTGTTGSERLNGLIVGNWINSSATPLGLAGYAGELLVVSGVVTTGKRQQIEGYLAHKWGLDSNLPPDHPYKNSPPASYSVSSPDQVTGLNATAGDALVDLTWTAPASDEPITDYVVEYTPSGGSASTVQVGSAATSYQLTSLTNGTQYSIRVAAISSVGTGAYSAAATAFPDS